MGAPSPPHASDRHGFTAVYRSEFAFVVNSLRRLGVAPRDIEDLAHDVFFTAYRKRDAYDPGRPIRPWLFGIAFRLASDFRQLARQTRELPMEDAPEQPDRRPAPDDAAALAQERQLVLRALARLELPRRAVFIMHDIEEMAMPEIAGALDIPVGTATSRLRQARIEFGEAVRRLRQGGSS